MKSESVKQKSSSGGVSNVPRVQAGSGLVSGWSVEKAQSLQRRRNTETRATRNKCTGDKMPLLLSKVNVLFACREK